MQRIKLAVALVQLGLAAWAAAIALGVIEGSGEQLAAILALGNAMAASDRGWDAGHHPD